MKSDKLILVLSIFTSFLLLFVALNEFGFTAFATDEASANLTISEGLSVSFTDDVCSFGSGAVFAEAGYAIVYSNGTATMNGTWTSPGAGLAYANDGNVPISISIDSTKNATTFIGGTSPSFQIQSVTTGCDGTDTLASFVEITGSGQQACTNMSIGANATIDFVLIIPGDALPGDSTTVITATASSVV